MRLFPHPWEGLHPAFPKPPPPFSASDHIESPAIGGYIGVFAAGLGALIRGRPEIGLTFAAYTAIARSGLCAFENYFDGKTAREFLASKSIQVPRRKFVERIWEFDHDNVYAIGALTGILLATSRRRIWSVGAFSRYGGAACFGAMGSNIVLSVVPWRGYENAVVKLEEQQILASEWDRDVEDFIDERIVAGSKTKTASTPSITSFQGLPRQMPAGFSPWNQSQNLGPIGGYTEDGTPDPNVQHDVEGPDEEDPQPHLSRMENGQRVFIPLTNYRWEPGPDGVDKLKAHIETLQERRAQVSKEAELFWHRIAVKEAQFYEIKDDPDAKERSRVGLQSMNEVHVNLWTTIGLLDWLIADSNKNILQIKAGLNWIPPEPSNAQHIKAQVTTLMLRELLRRQSEEEESIRQTREEIKASFREGVPVTETDPVTGEHREYPVPKEAHGPVLAFVDKCEAQAKMKRQTYEDLLNETEGRS